MSGSDFYQDILQPGEVEFYVKCLVESKIEDVGSLNWFESHHRLQKLNQQSTIEAGKLREETVKEFLLSYGKVQVLIHEAILIQVWRERVFKEILNSDKQPENTFIPYIILYHEMSAVGLLQNVLYHKEAIVSLEDSGIDLIDYCASEIIRLLAEDNEIETPEDLSNLEELEEQGKAISLSLGLSSVCILGYLIQSLHDLPVSAVSRLYTTHDLPLLLTSLIQKQPWKKTNKKTQKVQIYDDSNWKSVEKVDGISKYEGQCWIALRTLLLSQQCSLHYEIDEYRKQSFLRIQKYLLESIIDQISPLIELKQWLIHLNVANPPRQAKRPLLMETVPEIKTKILEQGFKKWKKIIKTHRGVIFDSQVEFCQQVAKRLGETYDIDHLERLTSEGPICSACGDFGVKKCSKCKSEWYCGRECQVKRWPKHKDVCSMLAQTNEAD